MRRIVNEKVSLWIKVALGLGLAIVAVVVVVVALENSDDDGEVAETEIPADAMDLTGQATVEISVTDNLFEPGDVIVSAGTEVIWTNDGLNDHNVKPDDPDASRAMLKMNSSRHTSQPCTRCS